MNQWRVRDVMTRDVVTMPADAAIADIASTLTEHQISGVAITDRFDVIIGVVSWKDIISRIEPTPDTGRRRWRRRSRSSVRWSSATALEVMNAAPVTVTPEMTLAAAGRLMHRKHLSRLLVVDDRHRLLGIVTRSDLLKLHGRLDGGIEEEVRHRVLRRVLGDQAAEIRVSVDNGVATLFGRTARQSTAIAAVALTESVAGVAEVVDQLSYAAEPAADEHPVRGAMETNSFA